MPRIIFKKGYKIHHGPYQLPKPVIKNEVETIGQGLIDLHLPKPPVFDQSKFEIMIKKTYKEKKHKNYYLDQCYYNVRRLHHGKSTKRCY